MLQQNSESKVNHLTAFSEIDNDIFTQIYQNFSERLYHFARKFTECDAVAEDITADAFIRLWGKRREIGNINAVATYLHTIVKNRCLDYLKHEKVRIQKRAELIRYIEAIPDADFTDELVVIQLMNMIYQEVDKLPPKMKTIFYLSYKDGLKPAQIAEKLQLSVQTVKNQRVNAIKLLRASMPLNPVLSTMLFLIDLQYCS